MEIGQAIRATRLLKGLTLEQVGARMGSSKASLSKIELASSVTFKKLAQLSQALDVPVSEIVKLTEAPSQEGRAVEMLKIIMECDALKEHAYDAGDEEMSIVDEIREIVDAK
jgi:transcriptional regulator with XRE-family HTH domain